MTDNKQLEGAKGEIKTAENIERTRQGKCYVPFADIYETKEEVILVTDLPGVGENDIDITVDKNILTINAFTEPRQFDKYTLIYSEFGTGDYQRKFALSNEIDSEKIQAGIKDGVLRLVLPKAGAAKTRKITVKPG